MKVFDVTLNTPGGSKTVTVLGDNAQSAMDRAIAIGSFTDNDDTETVGSPAREFAVSFKTAPYAFTYDHVVKVEVIRDQVAS